MRHKESTFRILAECENGYIGICECCREYNFAFKILLINLQEEELHLFFDWLISTRYSPEHYQPLPHGRNRVFSGPHTNLYLAFDDKELDEIIQLYNESAILLEVRKTLQSGTLEG